ncbi:MAG: OmpA family protein [Candidatus Azobacteroides sp.]|nr:OmpA family protein [Candidatus Azobacteroides sp.]
MKLKISLVSLLLTFVAVTFAQEAKTYTENAGFKNAFKYNSPGSNWFIQLGAGVQMLGAEGFNHAFFDTKQLSLAPTLAIGKWYSPWLGVRLKGEGLKLYSFPSAPGGVTDFNLKQEDTYYAAHFDLLWNVSNFWGRYNAKRFFSFIPYVGLGAYYRESSNQQLPGFDVWQGELAGPSIHAGLMFQFRLSNRVGIHIDLAGMAVDDYFNRIIFVSESHSIGRFEGVASATGGFTFNLGKTYFEVVQPMDQGLVDDLNSKINQLRAENELLSRRPESCPPCPPAVVTPCPPVVSAPPAVTFDPSVVMFRISSAVIDANQQVNIYKTAQFVKNSGQKIKVVGYADKATGTNAQNLKLSEKRAKAVAQALTTKYGIPSDKIVVEWKGDAEQPFKENNWNRVVIMNAQ